jgi:hypothetical protein
MQTFQTNDRVLILPSTKKAGGKVPKSPFGTVKCAAFKGRANLYYVVVDGNRNPTLIHADRLHKLTNEAEVNEAQFKHMVATFKASIEQELKRLWKEYVDEAEHQDGFGYWQKFKNRDEAVQDFGLYISNYIFPNTNENQLPSKPD